MLIAPAMAQLDGKIAFVTGAGSGLGREIALSFARAGARVAVGDLRAAAAAEIDAELGALDAALACGPLVGDVADPGTVRSWFERLAEATGGRLDILVNNAGHADTDPETQARLARQVEELMAGGRVTTPLETTARLTDERWQRMLAVHLSGTFFCTRAALPLMVAGGGGRIINMASIAGTTGIAGATHYSAAKGGIIAFTKALAREVGCQGILVNAIAPGYIETPLLDVLGEQRAAQTALIALQTVVGRLGEARVRCPRTPRRARQSLARRRPSELSQPATPWAVARRSMGCSTATWMPRAITPARIWRRQPGLAAATTSAPLAAMRSILRASRRSAIAGSVRL